MAFGWDDLIMLAASAYGASQSNRAGATAAGGGKRALEEQQRQFNIGLSMLEPQRALGYGALSDLSSLYGYRLPGYTPLGGLAGGSAPAGGSSNWAVGSPVGVKGVKRGDTIVGIDVNPLSNKRRAYGGSIDPVTGTVDVTAKKNEVKKEAAATAYLRGESPELKGRQFRRLRNAIDELRGQGWQWNPNAAPTAGVMDERTGNDMLERFRQMPGYQFGMTEGTNALQSSAANRGGLFSGDTGRGLMQFGQDYAGTKFGEEFNRLMAMAGLGQTATSGAVGLGQNYGVNAGNTMQNIADARASGVMGTANTLNSGLNNWMNYWLLKQQTGNNNYQVPADIRNFQYPFGG